MRKHFFPAVASGVPQGTRNQQVVLDATDVFLLLHLEFHKDQYLELSCFLKYINDMSSGVSSSARQCTLHGYTRALDKSEYLVIIRDNVINSE